MDLKKRIESKDAVIGVIGLGYVGLPLLIEYVKEGFTCIGFDIDQRKVDFLQGNKTYIKHIPDEQIKAMNDSGRFEATVDFSRLKETDCIMVAVPTPLDKHQQPDLSYIENTSQTISRNMKKGQLIVLESSTWPGTTMEVMMSSCMIARPAAQCASR